jgi:hypothetical protein
MLSWLMRRRERRALIAAEADALIRNLGVEAYAEACRRGRDANDLATARFWGQTAATIVLRIGERIGLDAAAARGHQADFSVLIETFKAQAPMRDPAPLANVAEGPAAEFEDSQAETADGGARLLQDRLKQAFRPTAGKAAR